MALVDERCGVLQSEINKSSKDRSSAVEQLEGDLETDFPKLQDCNKAEALEREEQDTLILKKIVEESALINEKINTEKRAREASEEQVLELLKGMIDTIRQDMELEKQTREESEETLLTLLEDTCTKLNNANIM